MTDCNDHNTNVSDLKRLLADFRDRRDWRQFHHAKDLAAAIGIEAGELLELFLWRTNEETQAKLDQEPDFKDEVAEELADVVNYCLAFANALDIDISEAVYKKLEKSERKYPVDKAKGVATKYDKL